MAFDILTPLQATDTAFPGGAQTYVNNLLAPDVANLDADGGSLSVAETADGIVVSYTAADGTVTDTPVDLPAGYGLTTVLDIYADDPVEETAQPAVFGLGLDSWLLPIDGQGNNPAGFLQIEIGGDGTANVLATDTSTASDAFTVAPDQSGLVLQVMGDGRVAYGFEGDSSFGILSEQNGVLVADAVFASGNDGWQAHFIALDNGELLGIFQNATGLETTLDITQYDPQGNSMAFEAFFASEALDFDDLQIAAQITDEGELALFYTGL